MKTWHYIAIGVGAVALIGGIGVYIYMRKKKSGTDTTDSTVTPPAPLDPTKQTGSGITKQTVAPRIPGVK